MLSYSEVHVPLGRGPWPPPESITLNKYHSHCRRCPHRRRQRRRRRPWLSCGIRRWRRPRPAPPTPPRSATPTPLPPPPPSPPPHPRAAAAAATTTTARMRTAPPLSSLITTSASACPLPSARSSPSRTPGPPPRPPPTGSCSPSSRSSSSPPPSPRPPFGPASMRPTCARRMGSRCTALRRRKPPPYGRIHVLLPRPGNPVQSAAAMNHQMSHLRMKPLDIFLFMLRVD